MRVGCLQIEEVLYEFIFIVVTSPTMYVNGPDLFKIHNQGGKTLKVSFDLENRNETCVEKNKSHFPNLHIYDELNLTIKKAEH